MTAGGGSWDLPPPSPLGGNACELQDAVEQAAAEEVVHTEEAAVVAAAAEHVAQQPAAVTTVTVTLVDLVAGVLAVGGGDDLQVLADALAAGLADGLGDRHVALAEDAVEGEPEGVHGHHDGVAVSAGCLLDLLLVEDQVADERDRQPAVGPGGQGEAVGADEPVEDRAVGEDDVALHVDGVTADLAARLEDLDEQFAEELQLDGRHPGRGLR